MDTIFALASARGRSGVAVIRVSGPAALESLSILTSGQPFQSHQTVLRVLRDPISHEILDRALVIPFIAPHSFTGENVVEYHVHGGLAVIDSVIRALGSLDKHRMAEAGEFTRRAFENNKMDLTSAEGLADLIHAETQAQKAQAIAQMGGVLEKLYEGWKEHLTRILAYVEADLEFPDEDLPNGIMREMEPKIVELIKEINLHLNDNRRGERLRTGIHIAVVGAPNSGKSSLVNSLAQREIAIVSSIAGTTRDIVEAHLDLGGYPVILSDTAGLRPEQLGTDGQDAIESEGIRRALECAKNADITILLYDGTEAEQDRNTQALEVLPNTIVVFNKVDLEFHVKPPKEAISVSVAQNIGIGTLIDRIHKEIQLLVGVSSSPPLTRSRYREALLSCVQGLNRALKAPLPELAAEDLRLAIRDLGRITGKVDVEDLLDVVFRDFCIGK